ncbi:MAG: ABC transporter ATP-binding protein [Dialister invisus]|jgi:hypothetical protein|uniref:ABC transporter ATP-binding protein n=1 Tax=Dialister invisus TaxID=218538 RepID=UPI003615496E
MFKKVLEYAGDYRKKTYAAVFFMVLGVLMNVILYFLIYQLIVPILTGSRMDAVGIVWRVVLIAVCAVGYAFSYVHGLSLSHESAYHTLKNIRISLQEKLERQPLGVIQGKGVGVIKKTFVDDIESIELILAHAIPEGLSNIIVPAVVFITMFFIDWKLALLSLASLPIGMLAMMMTYKAGTSKMGAYYTAGQKMNNTIVEYINGMEVVKVFNRDGESYERFETDVRNYRDFTLDWYKVCWPWMALYNSILPCVAMFTLPLGMFFVLKGFSTMPHLVLVLCMSFGVGAPLLKSISFMSQFPQVNYKIDALEQMMSEPPLKEGAGTFAGKDHEVRYEDVHFSYKEDEVLHGVSIGLKEGGMTALVGESGSGKSTLAKLLVHFYDVDSGRISIGGQDITDMSLEALNDEISFVSQEQFLFNMSLMENIRIGKSGASDEEVMQAAEKAQCMEFLNRLENGIHTMAGDGGKQLSGGERQRISLARAILKNASIIVLDEATAFVDPDNEEKMNAAIAEVIRGKTVLVIAHRLRSVMGADRIYVMKDGSVAAHGTHEELLENSDDYRKLWQASEEGAE